MDKNTYRCNGTVLFWIFTAVFCLNIAVVYGKDKDEEGSSIKPLSEENPQEYQRIMEEYIRVLNGRFILIGEVVDENVNGRNEV